MPPPLADRPLSEAPSRLMVAAAAILWSLSGMFAKSIALPGPTIACYRVLAAGLVLLPFVKWRRVRLRPAMLGMVFCFTLMNVSFISAMTLTTAANAIFLQYTAPLWIFLAGVFWLKEPADRTGVVSLVLTMLGVATILVGQSTSFDPGVVLALVAGVSYAGVAIFLRLLREEDPVFLTMANMLGSGLILLVVLYFWQSPAAGQTSLLHLERHHVLPLVAFGVIQMAAPYLLFSRGLKGISAQEAGIITLIEPMLNPLITYVTIGETPQMVTVIGGLIILGGLAVRLLVPQRTVLVEPSV